MGTTVVKTSDQRDLPTGDPFVDVEVVNSIKSIRWFWVNSPFTTVLSGLGVGVCASYQKIVTPRRDENKKERKVLRQGETGAHLNFKDETRRRQDTTSDERKERPSSRFDHGSLDKNCFDFYSYSETDENLYTRDETVFPVIH